jgi:C4-dicarboxylate transporter, DctQ subunit
VAATLGQRLLKAADRLEEIFMIVALTFMTVLTVVQVVLRYGFGTGWVWSLEATTYTFAWFVLIGMSYGVRTEAHIAVDLLTSRLKPGGARVAAAIALAAGLAYCALMIYAGSLFVDRLMALGTNARDIPLPRWVLTGIMPIAFGLLALRLVQAAHPVLWPRGTARSGKLL